MSKVIFDSASKSFGDGYYIKIDLDISSQSVSISTESIDCCLSAKQLKTAYQLLLELEKVNKIEGQDNE